MHNHEDPKRIITALTVIIIIIIIICACFSEGSSPDSCKALVDELLTSDGTTKTINFIQSKTGETIQFTLDNHAPVKLSLRKDSGERA